jgi:hypothetical protein
MPVELSKAHLRFLPLENLFTGMCLRLFQRITDFIDSQDGSPEINDNTIRDHIYRSLQDEFGYRDYDGFEKVIDTALIGFKIGTLWNNMRCTFTPAIVYKNGHPLAVYLIDIEPTGVEVSISGQITFKHKIPISFFKSGGFHVSRQTVEAVQELRQELLDTPASTVADAVYSFADFCTKKTKVLVGALRRMVSCEVVLPAEVAVLQQEGQDAVASYAQNVVSLNSLHSLVLPSVASSGSSQDIRQNHLAQNLNPEHLQQLNQMCESLTGAIPPEIQLGPIFSDINEEIREGVGPMEEENVDVGGIYAPVGELEMQDDAEGAVRAAAAAAAVEGRDYDLMAVGPVAGVNAMQEGSTGDTPALVPQSQKPGPQGVVKASSVKASSVNVVPGKASSAQGSSAQGRTGKGSSGKRKGGSRTRRRRSSSSTRSSTTRGRKAITRRNQSKKHKQSSRRRRSSRKSSRKN